MKIPCDTLQSSYKFQFKKFIKCGPIHFWKFGVRENYGSINYQESEKVEQRFKEEFFMVGQVIGRKNFPSISYLCFHLFFAMVKCDEFSLVFNKE